MFNSADISNFATEEKIKYVNDMTTERDVKNQLAYAHDTGVEEGLAKGREEGKAKERVEVARKFKELGTPISVISEATGLTEAEIMAL